MPPSASGNTQPEEVELWWGSCSARVVFANLLICLFMSLVFLLLSWIGHLSSIVQFVGYGLVAFFWLWLVGWWTYQYFSINYRLTSRRLFIHRVFLHQPPIQLPLSKIARVLISSSWRERLIGIAKIVVIAEDSRQRPWLLMGIRHAGRVAEMLREAVHKARSETDGS